MSNYYTFDFYFDYLLQAIKILHTSKNTNFEINTIYDWILIVEDKTILQYKNRKSIISFNNDLELFIEIIDKLIEILEDEKHEDYEKCYLLLNKKEYCKKLLTNLV
jgi:hypothetical protein